MRFLLAITAVLSGNLLIQDALADIPSDEKKTDLVYQTAFGRCPNRPAGEFIVRLTKTFDESHSLRDVKKRIVNEKLLPKHFVSEYQMQYDPIRGLVKITIDCPEPLMKVEVYKNEQGESYEAILVDNGELYDPAYEALLRSEHRLSHELPSLALPIKDMEKEVQKEITQIIKQVPEQFRRKISEVIVGEEKKLIIILTTRGQPCSAFLGNDAWDEKIQSLKRIVDGLEAQNKTAATIDLTNAKKVVVKLKDNP